LGEVVAHRKKGRESDGGITIFDSTGLAIQDIACAKFVYEKAKERGDFASLNSSG
jgi:ornithine cyclodeaminase/alanine dehydrogenase-like protein (mu-crystallin family)